MRALTRSLALSLALLCSACDSGFRLPGQEMFESPVTIKPEENILPSLEEGSESYEYPAFKNKDGSLSRILWMAPGEGQMVVNSLKGHPDFASVKHVVLPNVKQDPNKSGPWAGVSGLDGLMLTGDLDSLDRVSELIAWYQTGIPQVSITVRVVEVTENEQAGFGFDWFVLERNDHGFDPSNPFPALEPTKTLFSRLRGGNGVPPLSGFASTGSFVPDLLLELGTIQEELQIDLLLSALRTFTKVDVVNAPTVVCHVGHKAQISAGRQVPYFQLNISGNSTIVTTSFKDVKIDLQVLPHLLGNDTIRLAVTAEVHNIIDFVAVSLGSAEVVNPIIAQRKVNTSVDVKDGYTVVLGGLLSNQKAEIEERMPILGDIPLLKYFFTSRNSSEERSNLLFFIRPKIFQKTRSAVPTIITPPEPGEIESPTEEEGGSGK